MNGSLSVERHTEICLEKALMCCNRTDKGISSNEKKEKWIIHLSINIMSYLHDFGNISILDLIQLVVYYVFAKDRLEIKTQYSIQNAITRFVSSRSCGREDCIQIIE